MAGFSGSTYGAVVEYVDETLKGEGALKGKDGDSAYQIAVKNGFVGTEQEWLNSLKGDDSIGVTELKMLGWTVPKECTIQNEINGNQFIQKVGRIDLGKLVWTYKAEDKRFWANLDSSKFIDNQSTIANIYCYQYKTTNYNTIITSEADKVVEQYQKAVSIKDTAYTTESEFKTAVTGTYLYYELATPITMAIDGNEILRNNYSSTETVVGTWIDGKPIYRRVIDTTSPTVETGGDFLEKNIDFFRNGETHIVNMTGLIYSDSNDMVVPYIATLAGNDWCALYTRTTQKQIVVHMGKGSTIHIGKPMKIIVDYIK